MCLCSLCSGGMARVYQAVVCVSRELQGCRKLLARQGPGRATALRSARRDAQGGCMDVSPYFDAGLLVVDNPMERNVFGQVLDQ
jgi:hypothetical protein